MGRGTDHLIAGGWFVGVVFMAPTWLEALDRRGLQITINVSYRPAWVWWRRTEQFPMQANTTDRGTWYWEQLPSSQ
jgi:hypothetical protein